MYQERITQDPKVLLGKPVVRGTRIPVELVLAKLAVNPHFEDLLTDYPRLTVEDIQACLEYAAILIEKRARPPKQDSASEARRAV